MARLKLQRSLEGRRRPSRKAPKSAVQEFLLHQAEQAQAQADAEEQAHSLDERSLYDKGPVKDREFSGPRVLTLVVGAVLVVGSAFFVFWQLHPNLIFRNSTATGGDMGAHVWGPQFLKENMWDWSRLTGWTHDWYAGFPAFQFYMVMPYLFMVLLSYVPFIAMNVAFKIVAASGGVLLPVAAWSMARLMRMRFPVPALFAVATLPFLFNFSFTLGTEAVAPTHIWGGILSSLLAGEFAYNLGLLLAVLTFGVAAHGIRKGGYRIIGAICMALVGLCHVIPALYVVGGLVVLVLVHHNRRAALRWLSVVAPLAGLFGSFWIVPFVLRWDYLNNMGWEKNTKYLTVLIQDNWRWVFVLAAAGVVATVIYRLRIGWFLIGNVILWALAYRLAPEGRLLNGRLSPFYNLSLWLLAALGAAVLIWRLCGRSIRGLFSEGVIEEGITREESRELKEAKSRSVIQSVMLGLGGLLVVLVVESYFGSPIAEWGFETLLSVTESEAERLALELSEFSRLLAWGVAAFLAVEVFQKVLLVSRMSERRGRGAAAVGVLVVCMTFFVWLALPLRALGPFGERGTEIVATVDDEGNASSEAKNYYALDIGPFNRLYSWLGFTGLNVDRAVYKYTGRSNDVSAWANWNFSGYEGRPSYPEYEEMIETMKEVGKEHGCGRAMWEYQGDILGGYGTPMAPMLLPQYTDGCIGSMEGLYFESSTTVPFHFLNQSELSRSPSRPMRQERFGEAYEFTTPYSELDVARGVEHLRLYGVRYYMALTDEAKRDARFVPGLYEIETTGPWSIFLLEGTELVSSLPYEPVVWDGIGRDQGSWLPHATALYNDSDLEVLAAASGPPEWERVEPGELDLPRKPLPPVVVSDATEGDGEVRFTVDRVGVPVLVKVSYFPNWQVSGGEGPWRVTPNLMVVIPTSNDVRMSYEMTPVDIFAYSLTGAGILIAALLIWRPQIIPWGRSPVRVRRTRSETNRKGSRLKMLFKRGSSD